jgi:hypothetical protein
MVMAIRAMPIVGTAHLGTDIKNHAIDVSPQWFNYQQNYFKRLESIWIIHRILTFESAVTE